MKSPYCFIVKPLDGKRYNNTKSIGGIDLVVSTSQEDHTVSNRLGVVVSTPIEYKGEIMEGDLLLVHHNVFKLYYDMKGNEKSGASYLKDDLFMVDNEQFFMYFHDNKWSAHSKYCFVKPIKTRSSIIHKNTLEEPLIGTIEYINQELLDLGLSIGNEISFEPNSEYPFYINDEKLYRMLTKNITLKWN